MSTLTVIILCGVTFATALLSGIFGMAGGMILMGVLLAVLPVPAAMALHAVTQMASNGWRALLWWRFVRWRIAGAYILGCTIAVLLWTLWRYVPAKPLALLALGATPFLARLLPEAWRPNPDSLPHGILNGIACMTLLLLTGVAGPLLDQFFLGGKLDRREIVATKGACQIFGHGAKLAYFGGLVDQAASLDPMLAGLAVLFSMLGMFLSKRILEAMSDTQYRTWAGRLITLIGGYYLVHGTALLFL